MMKALADNWRISFRIILILGFILNFTGCHRGRYNHFRRFTKFLCENDADGCSFQSRDCLAFVREALEPNSEVEDFSFTEREEERETFVANFEKCGTDLGLSVTEEDLSSSSRRYRRRWRGRGRGRGRGRRGYLSQNVFEKFFRTLNETVAVEFRACFQRENEIISPEGTILSERLEIIANETLSGEEELRAQIVDLIVSDNCTIGETFEVFPYLRCLIEPCIED